MSLKSRFRTIVAFVTTVCFSASSFAATTAPSGFVESLFHYARTNQVKKIRYLVHDMGYDIDSENEKGDTAYCIAKEKNNTYAMDVLASFGANVKQRCGLPWGVIGTVAGVAAVGGVAAAAGGGGGGGGSGSDSCKDVVCGTNEHCSNGKCICDEGYGKYGSEQCHPTMPCVHGSQYNDKCLCDGEGYKDTFCSVCLDGYEQAANGSCQAAECAGYTLTSCPANASSCSECQSGTVTKYKVDSCIEGYIGDECESCALGYGVFDDEENCYLDLPCESIIGSTGEQIKGECVCNEGYEGTLCNNCKTGYDRYGTLECYLTLGCNETGGEQQENKCVCYDGYDGELCDECEQGYDLVDGECREVLDCGEHGKQEGNTCVCDEGYGRDSTGKCVSKSSSAYEPVSKEKANFVNEEIDITNSNYVDVIGKSYENVMTPEGEIRGDQHDLYLSYVDLNAYIATSQPVNHSAKITINNLSDGDVYALKTNEATNIFLSFLSLDTNKYSKEGTESALINVTNGGKIEGTEKFYTGGNGDVYGVYGGADTNLYALAQELTSDASVDNNKLDRKTEINITSIGSGDVYGMYGQDDIYNTLFNIESRDTTKYTYSGSHSATENAKIKVKSTGSGNVYGIYSGGGIHKDSDTIDEIINGGIIEATSHDGDANGIYIDNTTGTVETISGSNITVESTGSGDARGIADWNGESIIKHNGSVTVTATGEEKLEYDEYTFQYGTAIGIGTYETNLTTGEKSEITVIGNGNGDAYGIYDLDTSTITHNGIIDVSSKGKAYGICTLDSSLITHKGIIETIADDNYAYGIYGKKSSLIIDTGSLIDVKSKVDGDAYGVYGEESTITNGGDIIASAENGYAYGVYGKKESGITHGGTISASSTDGNAYGAYGEEESTITNEGTISASAENGYAYGVYGEEESTIINQGTISASAENGYAYGVYLNDSIFEIYADSTITAINTGSGKAYGIYGLNGSTINHQGSISASAVDGGTYGIYLDNSRLTMKSSSEINIEKALGTGTIYGIYVKADDNDSDTKDIIAESGSSMTISRTSDGETYGIYDESGSVILYKGDMNITTALNHAYGAYLNGSEYNSTSSSDITVENTNSGNAYGFYNLGGETSIEYNGTMTVKTNDGIAYGVYVETPSESGISVTTDDMDSKIEVESSGLGTAYGIKSDNGKVIFRLAEDAVFGQAIGEINVKNTYEGNNCDIEKGECSAYGIDSASVNIYRRIITVDSTKGAAIGINGTDDVKIFDGVINVQSKYAPATGIIAKTGLFNDTSELTVTSENSEATGIMVLQNGTYSAYNSEVSVTGNTDAQVCGIYAEGDFSMEETSITVENKGTGEAHGVYSKGSGAVDVDDSTITVTNNAGGKAHGVYSKGSGAVNVENSIITVTGDDAYGIYSKSGGNVTVTGSTINVTNNADGYAYGIYKETGTVTISVGTEINVTTNISNNAYGIYAKNANVINRGTITLNGESKTAAEITDDFNNFIYSERNAVIVNTGLISSSYDLNFDNMGDGTVALGKGGVYEALSLAGTMAVDSSVVEEGFEDTYVETEALKSSEIDVTAVSSSAMFDAKVEKNTEKDSANVVMTRKSFAELSASSSVAKFLEQNYAAQNNSVLFKNLKQATASSYAKTEAELLGYALLPNFAQENMSVLRNLNTTLNDELFTTKGAERKIVGYDHLYRARDTKGTLTGYENYANTMYFMYDVEGDNLIRKGFGMGITQFRSDYDDDSDRKDLMVQAFVPVSYINDKGMSFASIARFGYSDGEYERHTSNGVFESDLTSWIYGLSNAVRYGFDMGGLIIEPTAEFNVLGYYQNRIRENNNKAMAIKADAENNLSVEMGLGVNIRKDVQLNEHSSLSFNANAMYYHEFAKPYHSLEASMRGMDGKYVITDYENVYDRDRAMLSLGLDYNYKPFTFYGKFKQFIEDENPFEANIGVKYNF